MTTKNAKNTENSGAAVASSAWLDHLKATTWLATKWWRLRLLEVRMILVQAKIRCLQRSDLSGNHPNLRAYFVFGSVAVHHPIQIIQVFKDSFHKVMRDTRSNDGTQRPGTPGGSLATETRKPGSLK